MKEDVERIIKSYDNMKNEIAVLEFQLSRFKGISDNEVISNMVFSKSDDEIVQNSEISDKTYKVAAIYRQVAENQNDELYNSLFEQYSNLKLEIEFFEYSLSRLSGKLPDIMKDMVINKITWSELADKYHVSQTMISKYRRKAVKELGELYKAKNKHTEQYILS